MVIMRYVFATAVILGYVPLSFLSYRLHVSNAQNLAALEEADDALRELNVEHEALKDRYAELEWLCRECVGEDGRCLPANCSENELPEDGIDHSFFPENPWPGRTP